MATPPKTYYAINDEDADFSNVDVTGALAVTGASTLTGATTLTGDVTTVGDLTVGTDLTVDVNGIVTGTLLVTGVLTLTGGMSGPLFYSEAVASGAISQLSGVVVLTKAGVGAMTIADPTDTTDDGKVLYVISGTANAHTLDNSAGSGFNAIGAGGDIGTYGGAIGDGLILLASGGVWLVLNNINVTLA